MPNSSDFTAGGLGFVAGLVQALEKQRNARDQQQLQLMQLMEKSGRFELQPVAGQDLQRTGLLQNLFGGPQFQPSGGQPVVPFAGGGLTLRERDTVRLEDVVERSRAFLDEDEAKGLGLALEQYVGQPRTAKIAGEMASTVWDFLQEARRARRERERHDALDKRERDRELGLAKRQLLGELRGSIDVDVIDQIRHSASLDDLAEVYQKLPSPIQQKVNEAKALLPLRVEEAKQVAQARESVKPPRASAQPRLTRIDLALMASKGDKTADAALRLLHNARREIGKAGGDPDAIEVQEDLPGIALGAARGNKDAIKAYELLKEFKATGTRRQQHGERRYPEAGPLDHPSTTPGSVTGTGSFPPAQAPSTPPAAEGVPKIKSFKRIE